MAFGRNAHNRPQHRTAAMQRIAAQSEHYWEFTPGQRVATVDGFSGVVTDVEDGPYPGTEAYIVKLDGGMGGGQYDSSQLTAAGPHEASDVHTAGEGHLASDDYPELGDILVERPPLERTISSVASKDADRHEAVWWNKNRRCQQCALYVELTDEGWEHISGGGVVFMAHSAVPHPDHPTLQGLPPDASVQEAEMVPALAYANDGNTPVPEHGSDTAFDEGWATDEFPDVEADAEDLTKTDPSVTDHGGGSGSYMNVSSTVVDYPRRPGEIDVSSAIEDSLEVEADWKNWVVDKVFTRLPENDSPTEMWSLNWCRFRRDSHCYYPKTLNVEATEVAGYAVWNPEDRGYCPRAKRDAQKECPIAQPGPDSGEPDALIDATVSWDRGGQRGGLPGVYANMPGAGGIWPPEFVDQQGVTCCACGGAGTGGVLAVPRDGNTCGHCAGRGFRDARYSSLKPDAEEFRFERTAAWADVRDKATRIRQEGGVRIIANTGRTVTAEVRGDTNIYQTTIEYVPGTRQIGFWRCGCAWANYAWARSGRWKKYEGRKCAHATALSFEVQSQSWGGGEVTEQAQAPTWRQDTTLPVVVPGDHRTKPRPWRVDASKQAGTILLGTCPSCEGTGRASLTTPQRCFTCDGSGRVVMDYTDPSTPASIHPAPRVPAIAMAVPRGRFKVKYNGRPVSVVQIQNGYVTLETGDVVMGNDVYHPMYDPRIGLTYTASRPITAIIREAEANSNGVMVALPIPEDVGRDLLTYAADAQDTYDIEDCEDLDNLHITLAYLGNVDDVDRAKLESVVAEISPQSGVLTGKFSGFGVFENDDKVLVALLDIPGLERWREVLVQRLEDAGLAPASNHGFTPHCTLLYGGEANTPNVPDNLPESARDEIIWDTFVMAYGGEWTHYALGHEVDYAKAAAVAKPPKGWSVELQGLSNSIQFTHKDTQKRLVWVDQQWYTERKDQQGKWFTVPAYGVPYADTRNEARKIGSEWLHSFESEAKAASRFSFQAEDVGRDLLTYAADAQDDYDEYELLSSTRGKQYTHVGTGAPRGLCGTTVASLDSLWVGYMDALAQTTCPRCLKILRSKQAGRGDQRAHEGWGINWVEDWSAGHRWGREDRGLLLLVQERATFTFDWFVGSAEEPSSVAAGASSSAQDAMAQADCAAEDHLSGGTVSLFSTLHEDPEPALPEAFGAEDDDVADVTEGFREDSRVARHTRDQRSTYNDEGVQVRDPRTSKLEGVPRPEHLNPNASGRQAQAAGNSEIAEIAKRFLKEGAKVFSPAEQEALIHEEGSASNADRLDITGTHYEGLDEEDDDWLMLL